LNQALIFSLTIQIVLKHEFVSMNLFELPFKFIFENHFFRQAKTKNTPRLPSLYTQTLIKAEHDYRREMNRRLDQIHHDNRGSIRRRIANDHVFAHGLLTKRHQWFAVDKTYRDACRTTWNRQATASPRPTHMFLPTIYTPENISPLSMASLNTVDSNEDENPLLTDERIKQDFLSVQPVMLEILRAPHSAQKLKYKHEVETRKKSAQKRQAHIQTTAINDDRYINLVYSLQEA
jgi:hypothetical protein